MVAIGVVCFSQPNFKMWVHLDHLPGVDVHERCFGFPFPLDTPPPPPCACTCCIPIAPHYRKGNDLTFSSRFIQIGKGNIGEQSLEHLCPFVQTNVDHSPHMPRGK